MGNWCSSDGMNQHQRQIFNRLVARQKINVEELIRVTGFTKFELGELFVRFLELDRNRDGYIKFKDLKLATDDSNLIQHRVIMAFMDIGYNFERHWEMENVRMNFEKFIKKMAIFRRPDPFHHYSTLTAKAEFIFLLYDDQRRGWLRSADVAHLILDLVVPNTEESRLINREAVASRIMLELNPENPERVTKEIFIEKTRKEFKELFVVF